MTKKGSGRIHPGQSSITTNTRNRSAVAPPLSQDNRIFRFSPSPCTQGEGWGEGSFVFCGHRRLRWGIKFSARALSCRQRRLPCRLADHFHQMIRIIRLGHVRIRPRGHASLPALLIRQRRHHDHRNFRRPRLLLQLLANFKAADVRQHQVQKHHVRHRSSTCRRASPPSNAGRTEKPYISSTRHVRVLSAFVILDNQNFLFFRHFFLSHRLSLR